jgi:dTDP-4-dehydrorhamnose 3,5-epimerase and related enzymes
LSFSVELDESNEYQLFVPRGFAHGFSVLTEKAVFFYKCDNYYNKASESGIHPFDPTLNIQWKIDPATAILSAKDKEAQSWQQYLAEL